MEVPQVRHRNSHGFKGESATRKNRDKYVTSRKGCARRPHKEGARRCNRRDTPAARDTTRAAGDAHNNKRRAGEAARRQNTNLQRGDERRTNSGGPEDATSDLPQRARTAQKAQEHSLNATPRRWWRREQLRHSSDAKENNIYTRAVERGDEQALARAASGTASSRLNRGGRL